jgi:hypothetical protein
MYWRYAIEIALLLCVLVVGFYCAVLNYKIIAKVNEKLSEEQRFYGPWHYLEYQRLKQEYRRLYPICELRRRRTEAYAVWLVLMTVAAILFVR